VNVILLQEVPGLGAKGSVTNVSAGYARNYLIPKGLAEVGSPGKLAEFQRREEERKSRDSRMAAQAEDVTATLNRTVLTIEATAAEVAAAIWDARRIRVEKKHVHLLEPIKSVGSHMVEVEVAEGFVATVKTIVVPE
jgi:large subunit ribosomal protein L9